MTTECAEEMGIDLNSLDAEAASDENHRRIAKAKEHELLHLDRLRRKVEQMFPHARNFIRPGLMTLIIAVSIKEDISPERAKHLTFFCNNLVWQRKYLTDFKNGLKQENVIVSLMLIFRWPEN